MRCPEYICRSPEIQIERTIKNEQDRTHELPVRFSNLNTTVRRYHCKRCKTKFLTIELNEPDLNQYLIDGKLPRATRLGQAPASLRPTRPPNGP